jgi:transforming growth factor-beta-induced protein
MRSSVRRTVAIAALSSLALVACGDDDDDAREDTAAATADAITSPPATTAMATMAPETSAPMATMAPETTAMAEQPGTIVDVAAGAGTFNTLVAAVQAAGLVETLSGEGPFTVFAPTDEAFAAALESLGLTADELLADTETLTSILTYHVVAGLVPSSQVVTMDGQSVPTVNGADITISVDGDTVKVNEATVTAVDIPASNGVIHVIDSVLLPPAT